MKNFEIDFIDNQFQEVFYFENLIGKNEIFDGFSYVESFIELIPNLDWGSYNSIILIYNYDYEGKVDEKENLQFIGSFEYKEE